MEADDVGRIPGLQLSDSEREGEIDSADELDDRAKLEGDWSDELNDCAIFDHLEREQGRMAQEKEVNEIEVDWPDITS